MKAAPLEYRRVATVGQAVEQLVEHGDDAKIIAGGQSLVPMLAFRLARPRVLIDIGRIDGLRYVDRDGDVLRIGALTTHHAVETAGTPLYGGHEVLRDAARWIGHYPIRTRGTFAGSIAHADPSSEWCVMAVARDAVVTAEGPGGRRRIAAGEMFEGYFATALAADEVIVEVEFPRAWAASAITEVARRRGDFGLVVAAVALDADADRYCREARVVLGGVDEVPVRIDACERILAGATCSDELLEQAGDAAAAAIDPMSDIHADARYRRELAAVLVRRALAHALAQAGPSAGAEGAGG